MCSSMGLKCVMGILCGFWVVAGVTSPQFQLRVGVASGQFQKLPARVSDFSPTEFDEETIPVQVGNLHFRVPKALASNLNSDDGQRSDCAMLFSESAGFNFIVSRPAPNGLVFYRRALGLDIFGDEVSLLAAAYGANPGEASLWMSRTRARELNTLLDVRKMLPAGVQRVEVIRGKGIKGIVCFKELEGNQTSVVFDYYSLDESLSGTVILTCNSSSQLTMTRVRALFSSFRFERAPASPSVESSAQIASRS